MCNGLSLISQASSLWSSFRASSLSSFALAFFFSSVAACGEVLASCMDVLTVWDLVDLRFSGGAHPTAPVFSVPLEDIPSND